MCWDVRGQRCRVQRRGNKEGEERAYLAGGIDDLGGVVLVLIPDDFAEGVLDGGVVALDKVAVDELHRQARFAYAVRGVRLSCNWRVTHRRLCCRQWQSCAA